RPSRTDNPASAFQRCRVCTVMPATSQALCNRAPARCATSMPERQLRLVVLRSGLLQVRQDLGNSLRLFDTGDDLQLAAAAGTAFDLDAKARVEKRMQKL